MLHMLQTFEKLVRQLLADENKNPVAKYISSNDLYDTLDLSLNENGISDNELYEALRNLVFASPRTGTPAFFNQLFGGRNKKAILGELLSVILNNSMYTYKAAGPQIGVEKTIIRKICDMLSWDDQSDGTLAPGGSMTNFMSMLMARDAYNENIKKNGMRQELTVYTSKESHYSIPKNAAFSGIGRDNVRYVPVDQFGSMDTDQLEAMIRKDIRNGKTPLIVNCTAGTTVLGAFDDIRNVHSVSKKFDMWLHVDGAYCGSVLFSKKYRHLIDGIELVDSFSINAHKMLGTPLSCSIIVTKDKKHLYESFSNDASYLYQTDHDEFNLGKMSLQCGRRNDALKFWTLWKSVGSTGLAAMVDHQFHLAEIARDYIRKNPDYKLYSFDESVAVCFNYKNIDPRKLCTELYKRETLLVGYGSFDEKEFVRLVTINAGNSEADILSFFNKLENFVIKYEELLIETAEL